MQILLIYNRMKFTLSTSYKLKPEHFNAARATGFKNANKINQNLIDKMHGFERQLLSVIESGPSKESLKKLFTGEAKSMVPEYSLKTYLWLIMERSQGKLSKGRLKHYKVIHDQLNDIPLSTISEITLLQIEKHFRKLGNDVNTINSKMKIIHAVVKKAIREKLVPYDCMDGYVIPAYVQPIPDYLNEQEIDDFKKVVDAAINPDYKKAGYYFLLSCYAGYRINALVLFDYANAVKQDMIIIRAKKNNEIVSIPVYPKLAEVLEFIKDKRFSFAEETMRRYVKELALMAGLGRKIKVHTARHTFAMMLIEKGFTIGEVAELLGDSERVARVYARINNKHLQNRFKQLMG